MSEFEKSDELEYASLQSTISSVERLLHSSEGPNLVLANFLENAKTRVGFIQRKMKESEEKDGHAKQEEVALSIHRQEVERETALSDSEKRSYDGFLSEEFFTKNDFNRLDKFYSESWDRLSKHGKDEMSHRVWEGVRKGEYSFKELPQSVQEKEAKRVCGVLRDSSTGLESVSRIPEKDRNDFLRAHDSGNRDEMGAILERPSFRENMFQGSNSGARNHVEAQKGREEGRGESEKRISSSATQEEAAAEVKSGGKASLDISDLKLDGVQMAETSKPPSASDIPGGKDVASRSGPSLGSS